MATLTVKSSGGDYTLSQLQSAINAAADGDTITIEAGATVAAGTYNLPNKGSLANYITIMSDAAAVNLPADGHRITPSYAAFLPKIQSPGSGAAAFTFSNGANHYKFRYLELKHVPQGLNNIVLWGDNTQTLESDLPDFFIVDQCYVHGDPVQGQLRGIYLGGKRIEITNSYFKDFKAIGADAQAFGGVNCKGPIIIRNNYIEGAAENFILGGDDPGVRTRMTATGGLSTTGADVSCEAGHTLSELSIGQRISIKVGSVVEHSFITGITGSGATGSLTWSPALSGNPSTATDDVRCGLVAQDLTFRRNHVKKPLEWRDGVFPAPTGPNAQASTASGTLGAGTYYYKVVAKHTNGYNGATVYGATSAEVSDTLASNGKITVSWNAVPNAESYEIHRGTSSGGQNQFTTTTGTSIVDDGSLSYTAGSVPTSTKWTVKNLFELKACIGAQIDSNIFEGNWSGQGGDGYSFWLKSVNQSGGGWFCETRNITFEKNIIRAGTGFALFNGREGTPKPPTMSNYTFRNNLVYDHGPTYGIERYVCQIEDVNGITFDHNTLINTTNGTGGGTFAIHPDKPITGLVVRNNLFRKETYGILAASTAEGTASLNAAASGWVFEKNALGGANSSIYPSNNFYPSTSSWEAEFVNYVATGVGANFRVDPGGTWDNAGTDALDLGADIDLVETATDGVEAGTPEGSSTTDSEVSWQVVQFVQDSPQLAQIDWQVVQFPVAVEAGLGITVQLELSGRGNGWTNVSADVIAKSVRLHYGIEGAGVNDRVASPGSLELSLRNSVRSSGGVAGYYSPGHANVRTGFKLGIRVRLAFTVQGRTFYKFVGTIVDIFPEAGVRRSRRTKVVAVDWMDEASQASIPATIPIQLNQRADQLIQTILGRMDIQPPAVEIVSQGQETYPYALDTASLEEINVLHELKRITDSEGGYLYIKGNETQGGTLTWESRTTRGRKFSNVLTLGESQIQVLEASTGRDQVITQTQVTVHPRRVDAAATTVLFTLRNVLQIEPGQTFTILAPYVVESSELQTAARVGGTEMVTPVATTDYLANSASNGSGTNLTSSLGVVATFGASGAELALTNNGLQTLYVTFFRLRGKGIYDFQKVVCQQTANELLPVVGLRRASVEMHYQADVRVGTELAAWHLYIYKDTSSRARRVGVLVGSQDDTLLLNLLLREPSDRIGITETQTGLTTAGQAGAVVGYFIQNITINVLGRNSGLYFEFELQPADRSTYWILERSGASELSATTRLAFFVAVGHTDIDHADLHVDGAHADTAHNDVHTDDAHGDGHGDAGHSDTHSDSTHSDTHTDVAHSDTAHVDNPHSDEHVDEAHVDVPHTDEHNDVAHVDTHHDFADTGPSHNDLHADSHTDDHTDEFTDIQHADQHNDSAHTDTAHVDQAHADAHTDVAHGDGHTDTAHTDSAHEDSAHVDTHTDAAHSDTAHGDSHSDIAHGDA